MIGMMKETSKEPMHVKAWMGVMVTTFGFHAFFLDSAPHVLSFTTFFATLLVFAPVSFAMTKNVSAIAASHFIAWPIVLAIGVRQIYLDGFPITLTGAEAVLYAGYAVFFISLLLDYRIILGELRISAHSPKLTVVHVL
ncbi:MAG: hypothetical protein OEY05_02255 [Paracoccaceae bacterium]|nr:hypothetical protein [Paracoccaceae bacterium]